MVYLRAIQGGSSLHILRYWPYHVQTTTKVTEKFMRNMHLVQKVDDDAGQWTTQDRIGV